jgi:hypothetical protein
VEQRLVTGRRWVLVHTRRYHGLGNRVRAVLGGKALARSEDRELAYVWPVNRHFGASFADLWDVADRRVPATLSRALLPAYPFHDQRAVDWVDDEARRARVWQVRSAHALVLPPGAPDWTEELRALSPAARIREEVLGFHGAHLAGAPYVGVMVRLHPNSHQETLEASPLEWYVERLTGLRRRHPGLRFFVSADTPDGLAALSAAVPGCVGLSDKGGYNSRRALEASVADLYLLASSVHVVGPHWSSFPELAQHLAGPRLRLETSRTPDADLLESGPLTTAPDPVRPHERVPADL